MREIVITTREGWLSTWKALRGRRVKVEWAEVKEGAEGKRKVPRHDEGVVTDDWVRPEDVKAAASPFAAEIAMVSESLPLMLDTGEVRQLQVDDVKKVWRLD